MANIKCYFDSHFAAKPNEFGKIETKKNKNKTIISNTKCNKTKRRRRRGEKKEANYYYQFISDVMNGSSEWC